ncbi:methylated-DNA--[protein]-cysteine S-methyltransferase [Enterovibrio sp. ZSDZ35]|uniref:Methylated-DNA--protein-cysteine methyltransferase n=1 Tax=Enterovibrio qingdaonensis TaxID=2899818 RepID=A0ABT5QF55_9GAMM|nr:methylated-DNA--[protein]-cysteine S-methyltransferase [Enterovibrio sp. ZSDZ35]MDD1779608.1 methylated-DNA--[protein]-cysteine S-methyltransferase [Enterovibrio sp. ZSDZ35]
MAKYHCTYSSPLGTITLTASDKGLTSLSLPDFKYDVPVTEAHVHDKSKFNDVTAQLDRYFSGENIAFNVPLDFQGTAFQQAVWTLLQRIPVGETRSYGELAHLLDKPNASRAVGAANGQNPIAIIVPCHRVIGKSGKLTGYAGGLDAKAWLLKHEQAIASDNFQLAPTSTR